MDIRNLKNLVDKRGKLPTHSTKRYASRNLSKVDRLAVHHSLTTSGSAEAFARYHVNHNKWPGIGYHFVIEKDGTIVYCNDISLKTYHVGNSNKRAIGVCLVGDFRTQKPTDMQLESLILLSRAIIADKSNNVNYVDNALGHSEFPGYDWKPCPSINMKDLRNSISNGEKSFSYYIEPTTAEFYTVRRGDTIWKIAHEYTSLRTKELLMLNPDIDARRLKVGQKIRLR